MQNFKVGKWTVEPETGRLCRPEIEPVPLEPGVMGVLVALLEEPGRLWSKSDLIDTVWQGQQVGDGVVHRAVAVLCRILGSSGQPTIETIPDRGYRWIGPVEVVEDGPSLRSSELTDSISESGDGLEPHDVLPVESQSPRRRSSSGAWATWAVALGLAVGLGAWASGSLPALSAVSKGEVRQADGTRSADETLTRQLEGPRVDALPVDLRRLIETLPHAAAREIAESRAGLRRANGLETDFGVSRSPQEIVVPASGP